MDVSFELAKVCGRERVSVEFDSRCTCHVPYTRFRDLCFFLLLWLQTNCAVRLSVLNFLMHQIISSELDCLLLCSPYR